MPDHLCQRERPRVKENEMSKGLLILSRKVDEVIDVELPDNAPELLASLKELREVYKWFSDNAPMDLMLKLCGDGVDGVEDDFDGRADAAIANAEQSQAIEVMVCAIQGDKVRLGIRAPENVKVLRRELREATETR
jgi:sRNA-binding carbon storage regulator CsrA